MYCGLSSFPLLSQQDSSRTNLAIEQTLGSLGLSSKLEVLNIFGTRGQFYRRQLFHTLRVSGRIVWGSFQHITFIVHFISNLILQLIWQTAPVPDQEFGDPDLNCLAVFVSVICAHLHWPMAPHSSTLAWKIPWTEEPCRLQSMGSLRVGHDWTTSLSLSCIGEGNGNPIQYSCLENPRDKGA